MHTTDNYQLSQWDAADRILMADFNADNAKIDAAIAGLAASAAGMAAAGNCQVVYGTYTGTGSSSVSLTFEYTPVLVVVRGEMANAYTILPLVMVRGCTSASVENSTNNPVSISWGTTRVSWSTTGFAYNCHNESGQTYYYAALLMKQ